MHGDRIEFFQKKSMWYLLITSYTHPYALHNMYIVAWILVVVGWFFVYNLTGHLWVIPYMDDHQLAFMIQLGLGVIGLVIITLVGHKFTSNKPTQAPAQAQAQMQKTLGTRNDDNNAAARKYDSVNYGTIMHGNAVYAANQLFFKDSQATLTHDDIKKVVF